MSHPLAGTVYTTPKAATPKKMQTGSGAPSFCWECGRQLQRAPGKGLGLFFFNIVTGPDGEQHRIHGDCTERAILSGSKVVDRPAPRESIAGTFESIDAHLSRQMEDDHA